MHNPLRNDKSLLRSQIERAIWLGCARKYVALLNGQTPMLITSLHYFTGLVDEVAVYASPLSDNTVKAHYDAASTNNAGYHAQILAANPVGYWPFDEAAYVFPNTNSYPVAASSGTIASSPSAGSFSARRISNLTRGPLSLRSSPFTSLLRRSNAAPQQATAHDDRVTGGSPVGLPGIEEILGSVSGPLVGGKRPRLMI